MTISPKNATFLMDLGIMSANSEASNCFASSSNESPFAMSTLRLGMEEDLRFFLVIFEGRYKEVTAERGFLELLELFKRHMNACAAFERRLIFGEIEILKANFGVLDKSSQDSTHTTPVLWMIAFPYIEILGNIPPQGLVIRHNIMLKCLALQYPLVCRVSRFGSSVNSDPNVAS